MIPAPVLEKVLKALEFLASCKEGAEIITDNEIDAAKEALAALRPYVENHVPDASKMVDPDMPTQQLRLHMGELTANEVRVARAAIRWANAAKETPLERELRLSPPVQIDGWRPIETAPKDGTEIIICFKSQGNVMMLYRWNTVHKYWQGKGDPAFGMESQNVVWTHKPQPPPATNEGER